MQAQVKMWGNSRGIELSKDILRKANIADDELLDVQVSNEERAAEFGGKLNVDGEYDWGEPAGREVWE